MNYEAYKAASENKNDFDASNTAVELSELLNKHRVSGNTTASALRKHNKEHALAPKDLHKAMPKTVSNRTKQLCIM